MNRPHEVPVVVPVAGHRHKFLFPIFWRIRVNEWLTVEVVRPYNPNASAPQRARPVQGVKVAGVEASPRVARIVCTDVSECGRGRGSVCWLSWWAAGKWAWGLLSP
jgi:hypothetical protein